MKTRFLTKAGAVAFTLMIACGALTGCADKDVYNPNAGKPELKPEGEYFDFTTTTNVDFDVNYGKFAAGSLLEIYIKDPITYNENGTYSINGEAQYKIFADTEGCFKGKVELAVVTDKVYIYSPSWGAPMCVEANVENGKVTIDTTVENDETNTRAMATTRAVQNPQIWTVTGKKNLYSVVNWDGRKYGAPRDYNNIIEKGNISSKVIADIQNTLWKAPIDGKKPSGLDNSSLITDTKHINTVIAKAYQDENKVVHNIESAEIWLTFLTESAWHQNAIGYYYYPSDQVPTSANDVKKYILFPNASIAGNVPYTSSNTGNTGYYYNFGSRNAPISTNQKIQLLYVDDKGNVSTEFPSGYTIGYFIMPKEYQTSNNNSDGTYKLSDSYIYSNNTWNRNSANNFISLSTNDGTVVYGVEDGGDQSYEDILFCIQANPKEAIQDPDRPVINPDEPVITTTETTYRTYAFEDTWPTGGDYDLNDAIIEHKQEISFINNKNYVTKVVDTFTPMQRDDAATFKNAFAVQYASNQRGTIVLPDGAIDENETNSVILFDNAMSVRYKSFIVTRTFEKETLTKGDLTTDLNPFIISQYVANKNNRTEVHLPKAKATSKADQSQLGDKDDAYYVDKSGKYPFAIMIPKAVATDNNKDGFIPATEKKNISIEYKKFNSWADSKGTNDTDWYLHFTPIAE